MVMVKCLLLPVIIKNLIIDKILKTNTIQNQKETLLNRKGTPSSNSVGIKTENMKDGT